MRYCRILKSHRGIRAIRACSQPCTGNPVNGYDCGRFGGRVITDLMQFLEALTEALTDPNVVYMADLTPASVPSGLPVVR